jgi:hypothetical protein
MSLSLALIYLQDFKETLIFFLMLGTFCFGNPFVFGLKNGCHFVYDKNLSKQNIKEEKFKKKVTNPLF